MNIDEILLLKYPAECASGKIKCKEENDGNGIVISHWDMSIPKPTNEQIMAYEPEVAFTHKLNRFKEVALYLLRDHIMRTVNAKGYDSVESCVSYSSSTNAKWKQEALCLIEWRDNVYQTVINIYNEVLNEASIPDPNNILQNLPVINWPS